MPVILVSVMMATSYGSKLILIFAATLTSGTLAIEDLEGNLLGNLTLRNVKFNNDNNLINVGHLSLRWRPYALGDGRLQVNHVALKEVVIKQLQKEDSTEPLKLPEFDLPIDVYLDKIEATQIRFYPYSQTNPIALRQASITAHYSSQTLHIDKLELDAEQAHAVLVGSVQPSNNYTSKLTVNWQAQPRDYAALQGVLKVSGDLQHLELNHQFAAPINTSITASIDSPLTLGRWQAILHTTGIDPAQVQSRWPSAQLQGRITAQGVGQEARLRIDVAASHQHYNATLHAQAHYQTTLWQLDQLQFSLPATNTTLKTQGTIAIDKSALQFNLKGQWQNALWPLSDTPKVTSPQGQFTLEGTPDRYKMTVAGQVLSPELPMLNLSLQGQGSTRALQLMALQAKFNSSDLRAQGVVEWQPKLAVNLNGRWANLGWPLTGAALATSPQGRFHLDGNMQAYHFNLQGQLAAPSAPASAWSLSGTGDNRSAQATIQTTLLAGEINSTAQLTWSPSVQWQLNSQAKNLNPGSQWPGLPGLLGFEARSEGVINQGTLDARVDISGLHGQLRNQPVSGEIHLSTKANAYQLAPLAINIGSASLKASGRINDQWDIDWLTDIPALDVLLADTQGSWLARGTISGPLDAPRLIASAKAQNVVAGKYRVAQLDGATDIDLGDGQTISSINLHANSIVIDKTEITELRINGKGLIQQHRFSLTADTPMGNIALQAKGGYSQGAWTGSLDKGLAALPVAGKWQLASPFDIYVSQIELHLSSLCWDQTKGPGRVCGETDWSSEKGWQGEAQAINVPLGLFDTLLPPDTNIFGLVDAYALIQTTNQKMTAQFQMTSPTGSLVYRSGTSETVAMGYTNAVVIGRYLDDVLTTNFSVPLQGDDEVAGNIAVALGNAEQTVNGELHAQITHFDLLPAFLPSLEEPQGSLVVDLQASGTLNVPRIVASVELNKASVAIPKQGLTLRDIVFKLSTLENGQYALNGSIQSGAGALRIQGNVNPFPESGWTGEFAITGERFQALDIAEYKVSLSPDITVSIAPYKIKIDGSVAIPEAKLKPRAGRGVVSASNDVIIEGQIIKSGKRHWQIDSIVRIELGEKVQFEGFGLAGRLTGNIVIIDTPERLTNALGEIRIIGGRYQAYGQDLSIERGRLLFVGGPIDDPGIDVRAVRKVEDVTAGLNVRGPLRTPTVSIFSSPPMSDQNALAYLLLGRPVSQASANEGLQLYKAAASLGFKGGEILAKQLGDRFGVDDVRLESGGQYDEPTLLIGKYLSPRLYIGYGIGLINQINSVHLRYLLSKMWTLEANSGRVSGADLLYTLESN